MPDPGVFAIRLGHGEVALEGEVDVSVAADIVAAMRAALAASPAEIRLDLAEVSFIDCAGLGALQRALDLAAERSSSVHIVQMSRSVRRLLALTDVAG